MSTNPAVDVFVPDHSLKTQALARTTHLAIGAHPDDLEIMAIDGILHCYDHPEDSFTGVVMTDGRGSPRSGDYAQFSDQEMIQIRTDEQRKAASMGHYGALISMMYASQEIKDKHNHRPTDDLVELLHSAKPKKVYTHNLADKHPTHVAVALRVIDAIRKMAHNRRPEQLLGCEVWRGLDWLADSKKVLLDCSTHVQLQEALIGVFESQISGGKHYDLAVMGRRRANATFSQSHKIDEATHMTYAMDLTPLIEDDSLDIAAFMNEKILAFQNEVLDLLRKNY